MITALLIAATLQPPAAQGDYSEAQLKESFRLCEQQASQDLLDDSDAALCSFVYEELVNRVFKGDSRALMQWWEHEKQRHHPKRL
jgi:hypothetical protein